METTRHTKGRTLVPLAFLAGSVIAYLAPLRSLFSFAWNDDTFSYIPLVPLISAYFLYERRREIFVRSDRLDPGGAVLIILAILLYAFEARESSGLSRLDSFSVMALSFVLLLVGGMGLFYGTRVWKAGRFASLFLLFMAPIPFFLLDKVVLFLQRWSADAAYALFRVTGVPVYREGFVFHLPGLSVEVAKQCSGIRSSISLLLVSLLAGHLMLRDSWRKGALVLAIVPITIVKNAVRIVTLTLLGVYVDPRVLGSIAHRRGGIPIFFLALVLLGGVLWLLRRGERKRGGVLP
jgi:exosortase